MPEYEAVLTVQTQEGPVAPGGTVELSEQDAEVFLARGFVRELDGSGDGSDESPISVPKLAGAA